MSQRRKRSTPRRREPEPEDSEELHDEPPAPRPSKTRRTDTTAPTGPRTGAAASTQAQQQEQPDDDGQDREQERAGPSQPAAGPSQTQHGSRGHGGSQHQPSAGNTRPTQIQYDKAEVKQLETKIQKYKEEAAQMASNSNVTLTALEFNTLVGIVVRYMLFSQRSKPGAPVPRAKLNEAVTADNKNHKHCKNLLTRVLPEAQYKLISVFGLEMRELESGSSKFYMLRNCLPVALRVDCSGSDTAAAAKRPLVMVILALLHLNRGEMEEGAMWRWLGRLGVSTESLHPHFGKVTDEIKRLEATKWLHKAKRTGGAEGGTEVVYTAGDAARDEISERETIGMIEEAIKSQQEEEARRRQRYAQTQQQTQQQQGGDDDVIELDDD